MALFNIPKQIKKEDPSSKIKLKKGQTIYTLIEQAEKLVNEKLGAYKDVSKCITNIAELRKFFDETPNESIIRNRY